MLDSWLNPNGQIIEVGTCNHNTYAYTLLEDEFDQNDEDLYEYLKREKIEYPYEELHKRGWVRIKVYADRILILGDCMDMTKPMINTMDPAMNDKQIRVAKKLCQEFGISFHKAINDKIFW